MAYICTNPGNYEGDVVGNGQCVAFVKEAAGAPATDAWKEGVKVRGGDIAKGTAIATFFDGIYPSHPSGNHAAIYVSQDAIGIDVWDQWTGQPVHKRKIRFKGGEGSASNDGDRFSVVE